MNRTDIRWRMADTIAEWIILTLCCVAIVLMMTGVLR